MYLRALLCSFNEVVLKRRECHTLLLFVNQNRVLLQKNQNCFGYTNVCSPFHVTGISIELVWSFLGGTIPTLDSNQICANIISQRDPCRVQAFPNGRLSSNSIPGNELQKNNTHTHTHKACSNQDNLVSLP